MKKKRKFYHPFPHNPEYYELQGTKLEFVLTLIIGIIVVVCLGYKYYIQPLLKPASPKPIKVPQVGSTRQKEITLC